MNSTMVEALLYIMIGFGAWLCAVEREPGKPQHLLLIVAWPMGLGIIIFIASERYWKEMKEQLREDAKRSERSAHDS